MKEPTEKPIIFSSDMVKAILDGRKTQTRRVIKFKPLTNEFGREWACPFTNDGLNWVFTAGFGMSARQLRIKCPYGQVGGRLWVRETHYRFGMWKKNGLTKTGKQRWQFKPLGELIWYMPNPPDVVCKSRKEIGYFKRPSIFMPRWASRIDKIIKLLRAEHLLDISEADAKAEGFNSIGEFFAYWDILNKKRGFGTDMNPWNWVIEW